jgi:hypothetical protein
MEESATFVYWPTMTPIIEYMGFASLSPSSLRSEQPLIEYRLEHSECELKQYFEQVPENISFPFLDMKSWFGPFHGEHSVESNGSLSLSEQYIKSLIDHALKSNESESNEGKDEALPGDICEVFPELGMDWSFIYDSSIERMEAVSIRDSSIWTTLQFRIRYLQYKIAFLRDCARFIELMVRILLEVILFPRIEHRFVRRQRAWTLLHGSHPPKKNASEGQLAFADPRRVWHACNS